MTAPDRDSLMDPQDTYQMFDRIAPRYDFLNRFISMGMDRHWRRRAMNILASGCSPVCVLDIGCGTGDIALDLLRRHPALTVTGIDLSEEMLRLAVVKAQKTGLEDRVSFQSGDATALTFDSERFDGIVCTFCFRNIAHRAMALSEMRRVLRPGGRLVILELTVPSSRLMRMIHWLYTGRILPLMGRLLSMGSAYRYLAQSIDHFPRPPQVLESLRQAGFADVKCLPLSGGVVSIFSACKPAGDEP